MKPENLYHSGIVVDDLDATLDWFTKVAGYRWTDVVEVDQVAQTPDGEVTIPMRMAYSGDAPRVEIIQTAPGTIWVPADSGVHHLGYWSDDVESDLAALECQRPALPGKVVQPGRIGHAAVGVLQGPDRTTHRTGQQGDGTVHRILVVNGRRPCVTDQQTILECDIICDIAFVNRLMVGVLSGRRPPRST